MTDGVRDWIEISARANDVFDVATDFASYTEWNANITKVEIRQRDDSGRPTKVWMEVDAKLRTISYTLGYDYSDAPNAFSWSLADGDVKELEGSYAFEQSGDVTRVSYEMRIDPGFFVPKLLRRQAERQIARAALEGLKARVESGTGP
jgi:ribosome-associated toxin RatA of RatAB toxin-antitoxin module